MPTRRVLATTLALLTVGALLAGCSSPDREVVEGRDRSGTGQAGGVDNGHGGPVVTEPGHPLTAEDLPGWTDQALPDSAAQSLVTFCGEPTGLRDLQADVKAAALATPNGIAVLNQVATYPADPVGAITKTLRAAIEACPVMATDTHEVTVKVLEGPAGHSTLGAEIVSRDLATGVRDVTVYWAALAGEGTVEVAVSAQLSAMGDNPLVTFSQNVLAAAKAKAEGRPVGTVAAPVLDPVLTWEQAEALEAPTSDPGPGQVGVDESNPDWAWEEFPVDPAVPADPGTGLDEPWTSPLPSDVIGETGPGGATTWVDTDDAPPAP